MKRTTVADTPGLSLGRFYITYLPARRRMFYTGLVRRSAEKTEIAAWSSAGYDVNSFGVDGDQMWSNVVVYRIYRHVTYRTTRDISREDVECIPDSFAARVPAFGFYTVHFRIVNRCRTLVVLSKQDILLCLFSKRPFLRFLFLSSDIFWHFTSSG